MKVSLRSIEETGDLYGMRVIVRTSLDIPHGEGKVDPNHYRVKRAMPTIEYLIRKGARVTILTHVGRDPQNSTKELLPIIKEYVPTVFVPGIVGEEVFGKIVHMKEGTAVLLENLRSDAREETNDDAFARELASYANFYVNDAFAVSHREHASIVGIPKYLPSFAGITFLEEYRELSKLIEPAHPSLFILGGAKFETKEPLVQAYVDHYTNTFIGGALANDFMKARGCEVGASLLSDIDLRGNTLLEHTNLITPTDVVAVDGNVGRAISCMDVKNNEKALDIGPETIEKLAPIIANAKTILWNGPLGNYEDGYMEGTKAVAELIAKSDAYSVVGGGDTISAIESLGLQDSFSFLSTAGGAMLHFLEHRTLPGIESLTKA